MLNIGDRVRVTVDPVANNVGRTGVLVGQEGDEFDPYPYHVQFDDADGVADDWVARVEKLGTVTTPTRVDLVERARAALAGTNPTAADIIRLAEFLAG